MTPNKNDIQEVAGETGELLERCLRRLGMDGKDIAIGAILAIRSFTETHASSDLKIEFAELANKLTEGYMS